MKSLMIAFAGLYLLHILVNYPVYEKMNIPQWKRWIPYYNTYCLDESLGMSGMAGIFRNCWWLFILEYMDTVLLIQTVWQETTLIYLVNSVLPVSMLFLSIYYFLKEKENRKLCQKLNVTQFAVFWLTILPIVFKPLLLYPKLRKED